MEHLKTYLNIPNQNKTINQNLKNHLLLNFFNIKQNSSSFRIVQLSPDLGLKFKIIYFITLCF